jgi:transglutaminase-like putative cysteine protease
MKLAIHHDTTYRYADRVRASIQYLRLTPQDSTRQRVLDWHLELPPSVHAQRDGHGNVLHVLTLDEPHQSIVIGARGQVEIDENCECEWGEGSPLPYLRSTALTAADAALREFARACCGERRDRAALIELMEALHQRMPFTPGITQVDTPAAEAFALGLGVCQDHTHVFLACARSLDVPARYVSGYLCTAGSSELASHAWAEVWIDGAWYSFDVTNRLTRPSRHLKLAVGLDYLDACPVRGMRRGGQEQMHALVQEAPLLQNQLPSQEQ